MFSNKNTKWFCFFFFLYILEFIGEWVYYIILQAPVTTAVLKVGLHCQGCIEKILKTVSKTKGESDRWLSY